MSSGQFVCFLNASDVFASSATLARVHDVLSSQAGDGLLGWGELNEQIWASWTENEAFKMASLGFCHQSLYVRRATLLREPFDERQFKTDSDTRQLGRLYRRGARIAILPEVLAIRGGDPGISADIKRSGQSIRNTLAEEYPLLDEASITSILSFRRKCDDVDQIFALLDRGERPFVLHLARVVLDTLFLRQSSDVADAVTERLVDRCLSILSSDPTGLTDVERLTVSQRIRVDLIETRKTVQRDLDKHISKFAGEEDRRITSVRSDKTLSISKEPSNLIVSLTSFPARLKTVSFAIQSLLEQTCPPREVHLWLGKDEIPGRSWLPKRLVALEDRGLQIHFANRTFHQYDKFMHNAELNEKTPFVIVDDDVIYPPTALECLWRAHQLHPNAVVGNRCHRIVLGEDGAFAPYTSWEREIRAAAPGMLVLPTGAGGVLYPPGFLTQPYVTQVDRVLACAPYADDIWLKFCAVAQSIPSFATELSQKNSWYHRYTPTMQAGTLMATNVDLGLNDVQIARCVSWFEQVFPDWRKTLMAELAPT